MFRLRPGRRTTQPEQPARVDPKWGLRPDTVWLGSMPYRNLSGAGPSDWARGSGITDEVNTAGRAVRFSPGTAVGLTRSGMPTAGGNAFTLIAVATRGASGSTPALWSTSTDNGGVRASCNYGNGAIEFVKGTVYVFPSLTLPAAGVPFALVASHDVATGEFYALVRELTGGAVARVTDNNTSAIAVSNGTHSIGVFWQSFLTDSWSGTVSMLVASGGFLAEQRAQELVRRPWDVFRPMARRVYSISAGGGGGGFQAAWAARANTVIQGALNA